MKRWREYSQPRHLARRVAERNRRIARQIAERRAIGDVERLPDEPPGLVVEFEPGLLPPPAPVIALNAVRAMVEHHGFPLAVAIRDATLKLANGGAPALLVALTLASCIPARQRPPGVAPTTILEGSELDTGGAEPAPGSGQPPMWGPSSFVVQVVEAPPAIPEAPPRASRELCSPWWRRWIAERAVEHGVATDSPGWFEVARPPAAASDAWWSTWLRQELDRCAAGEPETPTAPEGTASWLGY